MSTGAVWRVSDDWCRNRQRVRTPRCSHTRHTFEDAVIAHYLYPSLRTAYIYIRFTRPSCHGKRAPLEIPGMVPKRDDTSVELLSDEAGEKVGEDAVVAALEPAGERLAADVELLAEVVGGDVTRHVEIPAFEREHEGLLLFGCDTD